MRRRSGQISAFSSALLSVVKGPTFITIGLAVTTVGSGCANTQALETEVSRLRRELHFVRQDLSKQKRTVEGLERRMTLVSLGKGPPAPLTKARSLVPLPDGEAPAPDSVTMASPAPVARPPAARPPVAPRAASPRRKPLPVVRLGANAKPKPVRRDEWVDPGAQDTGGPPLKFTMGTDDADSRLSVDRSVLKRPDPVLDNRNRTALTPRTTVEPSATPRASRGRRRATRAEVKAQYQRALALLRERKEPQAALGMFDEFLSTYPTSRFADNAAYWRGECFFALVKHEEAVVAFDALEQRYPKSPKVPFGLVRKGESLLALNRKPDAIAAFKKVTTRYATSEAAEMAKRLLARAETGK